jgi:hypothetical protein
VGGEAPVTPVSSPDSSPWTFPTNRAITGTIREYHTRFEAALQRVPPSHKPKDDYLVHLYTRSFNGQLGYLLRDKNPQSIQEAQEIATKIEGNLLSAKIEPFANPRAKIDVKQKAVHNAEPSSDLCTSISKLQVSVDAITIYQEEMMNRIVKLERSQTQAPRPPFKGPFQKGIRIKSRRMTMKSQIH